MPFFLCALILLNVEKVSQSSQGDIHERFAAGRREAESLKETIRAKRESSASTSRAYNILLVLPVATDVPFQFEPWRLRSQPCLAS